MGDIVITLGERLGDVFRVADHTACQRVDQLPSTRTADSMHREQDVLHHDDAGSVQLLHYLLRGNPDSADEQFGTALDDDVRECR